MNTDLRERVARAMAAHEGWDGWDTAKNFNHTYSGNSPDKERQHWLEKADVVLAELGLTQAEPVAWQGRRLYGDDRLEWEDIEDPSSYKRRWSLCETEVRALYAAPQPQASAEDVLALDDAIERVNPLMQGEYEAWQRIRASLDVRREFSISEVGRE